MSSKHDHAVVIGGSIAGLVTASTLTEFFSTVTVVERDELHDDPRNRRGVPQGVHLHGVLPGGRKVLDEIFGTFTESLLEQGAATGDLALTCAHFTREGWLARVPSEMGLVFSRRPLLEMVVRRLATRKDQLNLLTGTTVRGLRVDAQGDRVVGVDVVGPEGQASIDADFVVDATGRGSKAPGWLTELGFPAPRETLVKSFLGYTTMFGHLPEDAFPGDMTGVLAPPFPGKTRGGFVIPQENGLFGLMAAGQSRDYPPGDLPGLIEYFGSDRATTPVLRELFMKAEPTGTIATTRTSTNRLLHYNEVDRRPQAFLVVGDAIAAYNPVYGQGMTTAAMQAVVIRDFLRTHDGDIDLATSELPGELRQRNDFAWSLATGNDLGFEATEHSNLDEVQSAEAAAHFTTVLQMATADPQVARALHSAVGLQDGNLLFTPDILQRAERWNSDGRRAINTDPAAPPATASAELV
jgi:2-polyprenyl-6-methoxyphenol hydroxylase-like FAD-dependent oxidoreductase